MINQKQNGGRRTGAGRKVGARGVATLDKIAARELVRQRVTAQLGPLVDAQLANALGIKYLVTRNKAGKFIRVTEAMARVKRGADEEIIEVWEKDPNVHAYADLLDRALDRPQEQEIAIAVRGEVELVQRLTAGRVRAGR